MTDRGSPGKPSASEEEYFVREDAEKKRKLALQAKKEKEAAELKALKEQHWMHCPKCGLPMHLMKLQGVDMEVCFSCNGVFLDKADLEKLQKPEHHAVMGAILNWFKPETQNPV
jgi:uncharacterized protein